MKNKKRLMKINDFLSRKPIIITICIISSIVLFFAANYLFITILRLPQQLKNEFNPQTIFSFSNCFEFNTKYWLFYVIAIIGLIIFNLRFSYLLRISYAPQNIGQKGVARWTTLKEIQEQYKEIPEKTKFYPGGGGVPVARYKDKIYIDDSPVNNLIIGITRSGKGEMFVFPTIDIYSRAEKQPSMIITDPKLELAAASYETLTRRGYEVHVLNLINPFNSMGFNPLQLVVNAYKRKDYSEAELLANTFAYSIFHDKKNSGNGDNAFFDDNATFLLVALILAHTDDCLKKDEEYNAVKQVEWLQKQDAFSNLTEEIQIAIRNSIDKTTDLNATEYIPPEYEYIPSNKYEKQVTMYSIINTLSELQRVKVNEFTTALDIYFRERPAMDRAKQLYSPIESAGAKTKGSIISNALSKLNVFSYTEIAKMTAESSIDLNTIGFGDKPMAIFLGIPDYDKSNHFLASVFIRQLYFTLAKTATNTDGGKCTREVIFLLDEFGNLPPIESMSQLITVCLGRNIRFNLVIQSYSQIEELYGKGDASTIIGNCGNQLYILTDDKDTAEHYSHLIGKETITDLTRSGQKLSLNKTVTESYIEKPLLNANELMELQEGECVVKRVMKRTDNQRNPIKPTPIFNHDETKFKYRWQYLSDDFDNSKNLKNIPQAQEENRSYINLSERTFDIQALFAEKLAKKAVSPQKAATPTTASSPVNTNIAPQKIVTKALKIKDLPKAQFIVMNLMKITNDYDKESILNMTKEEYIILINSFEAQGLINKNTKNTFIQLLQ